MHLWLHEFPFSAAANGYGSNKPVKVCLWFIDSFLTAVNNNQIFLCFYCGAWHPRHYKADWDKPPEFGVCVCVDWCSSSCSGLLKHLWALGSHHLFQGLELKDRKQTSVFSSAHLVWNLLCCYFSFPIFFVGRALSSLWLLCVSKRISFTAS